jgi:hypothetical protein
MGNYPKIFRFLFILCILTASLQVRADMSSPIPETVEPSRWVLLGKAVKKFLAFRVVSVDLFLVADHKAEQIFDDIPKRLQVLYHVNIPKAELDRATLKGIEKNVSADELNKLMPMIDQVNSYYPDVESGDQIVITYIPGTGSEVTVKGEVKGIVPGKDFANAFFAIWVGDEPVDAKAKLQLLGKKNKES